MSMAPIKRAIPVRWRKKIVRRLQATGWREPFDEVGEAVVRTLRQRERRVLMIVGNAVAGDARVIKSAEALERSGFAVIIVGMSPNANGLELANVCSAPCFLANSAEVRTTQDYPDFARLMAKRLAPLLATFEPTHVYSHDFWGLALVNALLSIVPFEKAFHWTHDVHEYGPGLRGVLDDKRLNWATELEQRRLCAPDQLVFVNEAIAERMVAWTSPRQRSHVVHNVPREQASSAFGLRKRCGIDCEQPLAVYSGRVTKMRGIALCIDLLSALPELHLALLAGPETPFIRELKDRMAGAGVANRVHWFDYVADNAVASAIQEADFGIAPFLRYGNADLALATKLFEYVAAGLPIVASDCTLQHAFVHTHSLGETFTANDPAAFVRAVRKVLEAPNSYGADEDFKRTWSWETMFAPVAKAMNDTPSNITFKPANPRIFQGPAQSAGQPYALANALRADGHDAWSLNLAPANTYGYTTDHRLPCDTAAEARALLAWSGARFDLFHFHFRSFMSRVGADKLDPIHMRDLTLLRAMGKHIVVHFRGSEARDHATFTRLNPFAWSADDDPFPGNDRVKRTIVERARHSAHLLLVTDPELQTYVPDAQILQRAVDLNELDAVSRAPRSSGTEFTIAHAPTRRTVKGTSLLEDAVARLHAEGRAVRLDVIEGTDRTVALERLARADLVVDQLRIGWHGVLAVEAMGLGLPTMAYIRPDLLDTLEPDCPLIPTDPDRLATDIAALMDDPDRLADHAARGRPFVARYHDAGVVARRALELYDMIG